MLDGTEFYFVIHNYELSFLGFAYNHHMPALVESTSPANLQLGTASVSPVGRTAPKFSQQALYEQVAEQLRSQIFQRELAPGDWIDELKIAQELGISRTPLREALKVLAAEGLVTMKVRRGAYVTEVNEKDLRDVYHLLGLLESDAAAEVAKQAPPEAIDQLNALHHQLEGSAGDAEAFFVLNEQFHLLLLELANNRWRLQMVADLRKVMKLNRHHSLFKEGRLADSLQEHRDLMAALNQGNAAAARQRMLAHFVNGLKAAG